MKNNYWKIFAIFDRSISMLFAIGILLPIINKEILNSFIPNEIVNCCFCFTLGLYIGFQICKYEYRKVMRKISKDEEM